jgi:predicted nucleic acid-binding protein
MRTIDTNVLVYHLIGESGDLSERSSALMLRLKADREKAYLPVTAMFECIYTCQAIRDIPNEPLADVLIEILHFPGVVTDKLDALVNALEFWRIQGPLSFADCYHLALTKELGMAQIYTFDKKMDRYPGVERIEP